VPLIFAEENSMNTHRHTTAEFGDLVVAAYDEAARFSANPREVSRLATQAVAHMLRHARRIGRAISLSPPARFTKASMAR
jgi:hypothetical protein